MWLNNEDGGQLANISGADLIGTDLTNANLSGADLTKATLSGADLSHADLSHANLRYADLRYADLRYADLRGADIIGADLTDADLRGANLDFSAWSLKCGSLNVKTDERLRVQLMFHTLSLIKHADNATDEEKAILEAIKGYANKLHRKEVERL